MTGIRNRVSIFIKKFGSRNGKRAFSRLKHFQQIPGAEFVALTAESPSILPAFHDRRNIPAADVSAFAAPLIRHAKQESCGVFPMAHLPDFFRQPFRTLPLRRIFPAAVHRHAIGVGHRRNIVPGFGAPFYFQRGNPGVNQLSKMLQQAEILCVPQPSSYPRLQAPQGSARLHTSG